MAESPAHRFGQIIGEMLEEILQPVLQEFSDGRGLFLDKHGIRAGVRKGKKLSWQDYYGNSHDLDFVIEKAVSPGVQGRPVAFIEAAWRRYTKHSKNKVQEIQGAILPIAEKYRYDRPFLGAVLAGEFTRPSLNQLISHNFSVVHLPYNSIVMAFAEIGIDARFDEGTSDEEFRSCNEKISDLSFGDRQRLKGLLVGSNRQAFDLFFLKLREKLDRIVDRVVILPLFGSSFEFSSVDYAANFLREFDAKLPTGEFQKYEVIIKFSNGDKVDGLFSQKNQVLNFLEYVSA